MRSHRARAEAARRAVAGAPPRQHEKEVAADS
jgi:hypothetical protein